MTRKNAIGLMHIMLLVFLFFVPVFGSAFDKKAVIYTSLFLLLITFSCRVYKEGNVFLTKPALLSLAVSVAAFIGITYSSDKSSQFALGALFLMCAVLSMIIKDYKIQIGKDAFDAIVPSLVYAAALFYAIMAILHQIFIRSSFWGSNMDFTQGSHTAAACFMVLGIICGLQLIRRERNKTGFQIGIFVMIYVFLMAKSLLSCAAASMCAFFFFHPKKQKTEAFVSAVSAAVFSLGAATVQIISLVKNPESFKGAIKGLVSVVGVGSGGYNASVSVIDKGYTSLPSTFNLLIEAMGVFAIAVIVLWIGAAFVKYRRSRKFEDAVMLVMSAVALLCSSSALIFMMPVILMYYTKNDDAIQVKIPRISSFAVLAAALFFAVLASSYVVYQSGRNAGDVEMFEKSAERYALGAKLEIFNASAWEKAFDAECRAYETEKGEDNRLLYIDNAIKYNKKNYKYQIKKADVYTSMGDYIQAMEIWDNIMIRHDKEYLYPMYAKKVSDVMKNCPIGLEEAERLYGRLSEYAKKATDKDIVLEVNNILSESQQYYVKIREGGVLTGEMYENAEVEYESSIAES